MHGYPSGAFNMRRFSGESGMTIRLMKRRTRTLGTTACKLNAHARFPQENGRLFDLCNGEKRPQIF